MEQLIIRLGSHADEAVHWLVWSTNEKEIIASGELENAAHLSTLSERAGQRSVIALAPTSDVLLKWVTLPPKAGRKVINAIPFMLEDELAADISEQFFAMGPKKGDQQAVAIVDRSKLTQWQSWLDDANLVCETLIPDVLAVPAPEEGAAILQMGHAVLIRQGEFDGFQGEIDWALLALGHAIRQSESPVTIINYSDLDLHELTNCDIETPPAELPMNVLALEALETKFNLLQGEFKVKKKRTGQFQQWRVAAVLAGLALTTALVDKGVTLYQLKSQNAAIKQQIDQAVKSGFPNLGTYRDLRRKLKSELEKLGQGGSDTSLLVVLDQLAPAFSQTKVKPQSLRFDSARSEIRMQAVSNGFEALEAFKRQVESAGFEVEQGAINNKDNQMIGNLTIRSGS